MASGVNIARAGYFSLLNYTHMKQSCHQCAHRLLQIHCKQVSYNRPIACWTQHPRLGNTRAVQQGRPSRGHRYHVWRRWGRTWCSDSRAAVAEAPASLLDCDDGRASHIDPYSLVRADLASLTSDIRKEIGHTVADLAGFSGYHFDGEGKSVRPMLLLLVARACNGHRSLTDSVLLPAQKTVSLVSEMIHTASLIHDDVIDKAAVRRGKPSLQNVSGQKRAILTGDYILARACIMLARLGNNEVVTAFAQILNDLITGEFMQLGSKEDESERFTHYLSKTFKKTASLLANGCKSVAIMGQCSEEAIEHAYLYGKNIGIAFQLVDDMLDFLSSDEVSGKPTNADLRLGLATAPVLFAALQFPQLNPMIMRRFANDGDVETALSLVKKSTGITQTRYLARQHCLAAIRQLWQLAPSAERTALIFFSHTLLRRLK